jgi:hypothetical protein
MTNGVMFKDKFMLPVLAVARGKERRERDSKEILEWGLYFLDALEWPDTR